MLGLFRSELRQPQRAALMPNFCDDCWSPLEAEDAVVTVADWPCVIVCGEESEMTTRPMTECRCPACEESRLRPSWRE